MPKHSYFEEPLIHTVLSKVFNLHLLSMLEASGYAISPSVHLCISFL